MKQSKLEAWFKLLLDSNGIKGYVQEHKFHPTRYWRFDYSFPKKKIGVELNGGIWSKGRHTRGKGYIGDMEKMNAAVLLGWRVLQYTNGTMHNAIEDLQKLLF